MKKLILIILALWSFTAYGQSYSSPGRPAGVDSKTPTFGIKTVSPDSLSQLWLSIGGNRWFRLMTGMDVIVFDARVVQGLGTTSSKLTFRDTLLKSNWIINPADTLHPALTVISDKAQAGLLIKPNESTDGRAVVQMRSAKNNQWWEVGANPAGQNKSFGIRRMNGVALPAVDYLWYVEPFTDTSVFPHQVRFTNTRAYTPGDSVAYLKNGFLEIGPASGGTTYTATGGVVLSGTSFRLGSGTLQGGTVAISSPTTTNFSMSSNSGGNTVGMQMFSGVLQLTSHKSGNGTAFMQFTNPSDAETKMGYQNSTATTEKSLTFGIANKGIYHIDNVDTIGDRYADTSYAANGKRYDTWIPTWKAVKSRIDSAVSASGGGGSTGINGLNGTTNIGLGGTLSGNVDENIGANSIDWHGDNGTYAVDNLIDNTPGGSLISSQASNSAGSHYAAVNIGITSPTGWYAELATNKSGSGASIQLDGNTGNTTITNTLGSFGAQYGADYSTALRLNPNGIASVKTVIALADSVKGTISGGATGANPTASIGFTAVNGSAATFTRSDGAPKADSTVIRSVANSYSLSGMQTKLNNYALTSALPVGANPTGTAGTSAVNGSATTFMRSDAAPKVDSAVFRTVANSYSLSGLQTKFNGYVPTSTTVAGFPLSSNVTLGTLTLGRGLLGTSYNGSAGVTAILDTTQNYNWLKAQTITKNALGTTQTEGFRLQNTTAAALGAVQISPYDSWLGNNWATGSSASIQFGFRAYTLPIQNSSGYNGEWHLQGLTALNTWADALKVDNGGTLTAVNFVSNGGEVNSGTFRNASSNSAIFLQTARTFNASGNIITFNPGSITNSSGLVIGLNATQTINQTSTASYTYNQVNLTETAVGSGGAKFVDYQVAGTSKYSVKDDGTINSAVLTASTPLQTDASKNIISSPVGQTTLVAGTKAITITGLTTSSKAFVTLVSQGGTVTTTQVYAAVCTSNTLTITALTTAGATDTTDTSVLNYFVVVQ